MTATSEGFWGTRWEVDLLTKTTVEVTPADLQCLFDLLAKAQRSNQNE